MICEAYAKGFKPAAKLWAEVCRECVCTRSQFFDAVSDHPSDLPVIHRIRKIASEILERTPELTPGSFGAECTALGKGIEEVYSIYREEHPGSGISYEMFCQAASAPYTLSDYSIAKAADGILGRIRAGTICERS